MLYTVIQMDPVGEYAAMIYGAEDDPETMPQAEWLYNCEQGIGFQQARGGGTIVVIHAPNRYYPARGDGPDQ